MNADTKITLTVGLLNGVLQYLGSRPYQEVFALVQEIQKQAAAQLPPEADKDASTS